MIQQTLTQYIRVPQNHKFGILGLKPYCYGIKERIRTMQHDNVRLDLVENPLEMAVIRECNVLT